jgi:hypothetical protein
MLSRNILDDELLSLSLNPLLQHVAQERHHFVWRVTKLDGSKNRGFDGLDHAPVVMSVRSAGWPGNPVFSTLKIA